MKIGFIGTGNMGGAILKGYSKQAAADGNMLLGYNCTRAKLEQIAEAYPVTLCDTMEDLVQQSDIIILGVKPDRFDTVLPQVEAQYRADQVVVSMAAGISIRRIESELGETAKVVRIMPNTPALVGEAMISVSRNPQVEDGSFAEIMKILNSIGRAEEVPESLIHCVIGVSGSSPAYTYLYIDALIQAAVQNGMAPDQARVFAAQSVLGAAKMAPTRSESVV